MDSIDIENSRLSVARPLTMPIGARRLTSDYSSPRLSPRSIHNTNATNSQPSSPVNKSDPSTDGASSPVARDSRRLRRGSGRSSRSNSTHDVQRRRAGSSSPSSPVSSPSAAKKASLRRSSHMSSDDDIHSTDGNTTNDDDDLIMRRRQADLSPSPSRPGSPLINTGLAARRLGAMAKRGSIGSSSDGDTPGSPDRPVVRRLLQRRALVGHHHQPLAHHGSPLSSSSSSSSSASSPELSFKSAPSTPPSSSLHADQDGCYAPSSPSPSGLSRSLDAMASSPSSSVASSSSPIEVRRSSRANSSSRAAFLADISDRLKATAKQSSDDDDDDITNDDIDGHHGTDDDNGADGEDSDDDHVSTTSTVTSSSSSSSSSSRLGLGLGGHRSSTAVMPSSRAPRILGLGAPAAVTSSRTAASNLLRGQLLARARQSTKGQSPRSAVRSLAAKSSSSSSSSSPSPSSASSSGASSPVPTSRRALSIQSSLVHTSLGDDSESPATMIAASGRTLFTSSSLERAIPSKQLDISVHAPQSDDAPDEDEWKTPVRSSIAAPAGSVRPLPLRLASLHHDDDMIAPYSPKRADGSGGLSLSLTPKTSPTRDYSSPRRLSRSLRVATPTSGMDGKESQAPISASSPSSLVASSSSLFGDEFEFLGELRAQNRLPPSLMASPRVLTDTNNNNSNSITNNGHSRPRSSSVDYRIASLIGVSADSMSVSPSIQAAKRRRMADTDDDTATAAVDDDERLHVTVAVTTTAVPLVVIAPVTTTTTSNAWWTTTTTTTTTTSSVVSSVSSSSASQSMETIGDEVSSLPPSPQQISACRRLVDLAIIGNESPLSMQRHIALAIQ